MEQDTIRISRDPLFEFAREVFSRVGMSPENATTEAEVLLWASQRGVDSHGVQLISTYVGNVEKGYMNPKPDIQIIQETAATLFVEADRSFGPVVTTFTMNRLMDKAREAGIGWGLIRNTTHQGAMGYYVEMAAKQNMAGIALVCNPPNMAPTGARSAGVHNSPLAIAVPAQERPPILFDMATSVAAHGKIGVAIDKGVSIPDDWAIDAEGNPTTDPKKARVLLPAGGYKGYGLALMFECLSSVMMGNPLLGPCLHDQDPPLPYTQNSVVAAINIGSFTDPDGYRQNIDNLVAGLKGLPTVEGVDEVLVPGEPENKVYDDRTRNGIPLPPGLAQKLRDVGQQLGIALPAGL